MSTRHLRIVILGLSAAACGSDIAGPPVGALAGKASKSVAVGSWTLHAPIGADRYASASVGVGSRIYTFGGVTAHVDCTYTTDTRIYDVPSDAWIAGAPMPTSRAVMSATEIDGRIYVVGGGTGCGVYTGATEVYTIATNSWAAETPIAPRYNPVVQAVNGTLYVIGGSFGGDLDRVEAFDPTTHAWTTKAPMPTKRGGAASGVLSGKVYVIGGCCGTGSTTAVEAYEPATNTWQTLSDLPASVNGAMAGVVDGVIYVVGAGASLTEVYSYDQSTDTWTANASLPVPLIFEFGGVALGRLYAIGGISNNRFQRVTFAFTPGVRPPAPNVAPVARAGADQRLECVSGFADVTLDGGGSTDADGLIAGYEWTSNALSIGASALVTRAFALGAHTVGLRVIDNAGATGSDDVGVEVSDTQTPTIGLDIIQATLWSPNHRMERVATVRATDQCDSNLQVRVTVSSNEAANRTGDGNTEVDWHIVPKSDGSFDVYVRAERSGLGNGRVYTITAGARDASGNAAAISGTVSVPKRTK